MYAVLIYWIDILCESRVRIPLMWVRPQFSVSPSVHNSEYSDNFCHFSFFLFLFISSSTLPMSSFHYWFSITFYHYFYFFFYFFYCQCKCIGKALSLMTSQQEQHTSQAGSDGVKFCPVSPTQDYTCGVT